MRFTIKHGHASGGKQSPEYSAWAAMVTRCKPTVRYPMRKYYFDSGISVCERWGSFIAFFEDMGPKPHPKMQLDRRDNTKGYSPDNCRWATVVEQLSNKRNNRWLLHQGQRRTIAGWAKHAGLETSVLNGRLKNGWSLEDALSAPVRAKNKNRSRDAIAIDKARPRRRYKPRASRFLGNGPAKISKI